MSWKIRQFIRNYGKLILIGLLAFTGYAHLTGGGGSAGRMARNSTRWVYDVPVAGSLLRSSRNFTQKNLLSYSGSSKRYSKAAGHGRKKHGRKGRRSRRR
jgi:hypothetical protein